MLDWPYMSPHHHLDPRAAARVRFCVRHTRGHVQYRADRHGLFERARVQIQEAWSRMGERCGARECQFEGLLEKVATKDHAIYQESRFG